MADAEKYKPLLDPENLFKCIIFNLQLEHVKKNLST